MAISQTAFSDTIETFSIFIRISSMCIRKCIIDNMSALVQVMAWRQTGWTSLSTYMRHYVEMG